MSQNVVNPQTSNSVAFVSYEKSDSTHGQQEGQVGSYKGESVVARSNVSSVLDAAEELTFSMSETTESEEKKLSERGIKKAERNYLLAEVQEILRQMQDFDQNDVAKALQRLKSMNGFSLATLNQEIRNTFKDSTHQHGALLMLQKAFQDDATALETIGQAITQLEAEKGAEIRAGYNIAQIKDNFESTSAEKRVLYRDTILFFDSYEKTFLSLIDKYGEKDFAKALDFLNKALSADMRSAHTSMEMSELKEIADGIGILQNLTSFYQDTCHLLEQIAKFHSDETLSAKSIMIPLLSLKDQQLVTVDTIQMKMPFLESDNPIRDAALTQGTLALIQNLPHKIFTTTDTRLQLIDSFKELMDVITVREEALYE